MKVSLRIVILAILYLVALNANAAADQWDDLARKFIDQEQARLVRRATDASGVVIELKHPLITKSVVIAVADGRPGISFQFNSARAPGDLAFALMSRGGSLVTGKEAMAILKALRESYQAALEDKNGMSIVSSDGISVSCIIIPGDGELSFLLATN
jgi:hypothetical protein